MMFTFVSFTWYDRLIKYCKNLFYCHLGKLFGFFLLLSSTDLTQVHSIKLMSGISTRKPKLKVSSVDG